MIWKRKPLSRGAGEEGAIVAALAGLTAIIDHSISNEGVHAGDASDMGVAMRYAWSVL